MKRERRPWLLIVSFFLALLLGVMPMPEMLQPFRPYWLALVLAYWVFEKPESVGLGFAFGIGLLADLVFGDHLGEQALRLVIFTFILQRFRAQLRFFPLSQQALAMGALLLNDRVVVAAIHLVLGEQQWPVLYWWSPLIGMLMWIPVFLVLDTLRLGARKE